MADLTVTADEVRILDTSQRFTINAIADAAITRGQPVYEKTNGRVGLARANADGTADVSGIATNDASAGDPVTLLQKGRLVGFDLSGMDSGEKVYLSAATAGKIADTAPSTSGQFVVPLGRVHTATGSGKFKYILFDCSPAFDPVEIPAG